MDVKFTELVSVEDNEGNVWRAYGEMLGLYVVGWMVNHRKDSMLLRGIDSSGEHVAMFCKDFTFEGKGLMTRVRNYQ